MYRKPPTFTTIGKKTGEDEIKSSSLQWRNDLQELGILSEPNKTAEKIREAGPTSVLACLQSPITVDMLEDSISDGMRNAIRRTLIFKRMSLLMEHIPADDFIPDGDKDAGDSKHI